MIVLYHPSQNRTIPRKALRPCHMNALLALRPCKAFGRSTSGIHARPLSKGGGLTARHKLLLCCFLLAICPSFLYCKLFCRQDGGIALHPPILRSPQPLQKNDNPSPHTNPPKTALSLAFHNANIYIYLYAFTSALSHSLFVGERARPSRCTNPCHSHNHCKRKITPSLHTTPSKTALSLAPH